jgi:hypothetical protein
MLTACKLWEKVSAKGNRYLMGRMGGVRVMVMTNTRPEGENRLPRADERFRCHVRSRRGLGPDMAADSCAGLRRKLPAVVDMDQSTCAVRTAAQRVRGVSGSPPTISRTVGVYSPCCGSSLPLFEAVGGRSNQLDRDAKL